MFRINLHRWRWQELLFSPRRGSFMRTQRSYESEKKASLWKIWDLRGKSEGMKGEKWKRWWKKWKCEVREDEKAEREIRKDSQRVSIFSRFSHFFSLLLPFRACLFNQPFSRPTNFYTFQKVLSEKKSHFHVMWLFDFLSKLISIPRALTHPID